MSTNGEHPSGEITITTRPRLPSEHEAKLAAIDMDRERSYEQIEIVTEQLREVADALLEDDGVPIFVDTDDDHSLVTSIEGVRALVR